MNNLTNKELIEKLQKFNPDAEVLINVKQYNKVYGVVQLPIHTSNSEHSSWVDGSYNGCTITVHLPSGAYISKLPK